METTNLDEILAHVGVKGMKWGVRRRSPKHPPSEDVLKTNAHMTIVKRSGTKALSNKELQELVTRMNLEQQFSKLKGPSPAAKTITIGSKFAGKVVAGVAQQQVNKVVNDVVSKKVATMMSGK